MADVPTPPETPQRRRHRVRRFLTVGAIVLFGLIGGLLALLHTRPARQYAADRVTRLLRQQNIDFDSDQLSYNLLALRLALTNVRVRSQAAEGLPPFATIGRVDLDLSLRALLRGRYVLQSGVADRVAVHYIVTADGRDNLPRPPRNPDEPSEPLDYLIDEMEIRNAQVRYENQPQRLDATLSVPLLRLDGNPLTDRHAATLEASKGRLILQDRAITIDRLAGEVDLGDDDARIARVEAAAEGAELAMAGTITHFADPRADLTAKGTLDAARASAIAGVAEPVAGLVNFDATAKGPVAAPAIEGRIGGTAVRFRTLSDVALSATGSYDLNARRGTLSDFTLRAPFGNVSGRGAVSMSASDTSNLTATVSSLDAAPLMRAFDMPYIAATRVDAQIQAEWPGVEYLKASGSARAHMTPTAARPSKAVIPVGGRIDVSGRANAIDAVLTGVSAAGAELNGRVRVVERERLDGTAALRVADVARAVSAAEAITSRRDLVPARVAGGLTATARIGGSVRSPQIAAHVLAPALAVGNARSLSLATDVGYTPAAIDVRRLSVHWNKAQVAASGTIGLAGAKPVNLTVDASSLEVAEILGALEQQVPASGLLSFNGRVAGTLARPSASVALTGSNLAAYSERWGNLAARLSLEGRQVMVSSLVLDKPQPQGNGRVTANGTYDLDRRAYSADLRSQNVRLIGLTLPGGRQVRGTLQLTARGTGTIDRPAGTLAVAADALRIDQYDIGRVVADAGVHNQQATITAAVPMYQVSVDALIGVQRPYATTARMRIDDLDLATLPLQSKTPLEGRLRAMLEAAGDLEAPERMQAHATVDALAGSWNRQPFRIDTPARLRYANERVAIDRLRLVAADSTVDVRGELPVRETGAPGAISLDARGNLATLARYAPAGTNLTGAGQVSLAGEIRGTLRAIDPDLTIVVANGSLVTPAIAPGVTGLNVRVRVADGAADIEQLAARWGTARISANGRVPFEVVPPLPVDIPRRGGPATFNASIQGLDLAEVPGAPEGLTGRVSVDAQVAATRADLLALEGRVTFPDLQLALNGLTLAQAQPSAIRFANGIAQVERFTLTGSVGSLSAAGSVGLTGTRPINVDAKGNLNVAVISVFTDAVRAEGDTTLSIAARGTIAAPDLGGFVDLQNAQFVLDEPAIAAEQVKARLLLAGRRIELAELTGTLNGGSLKGSGHVELGAGGLADAALEVVTDDVAFDAPLDLRSLSDARVIFRRRDDEFVVEGQVTLDEAGLTGDINFDEGLLAAVAAPRTLDLTETRNPLLEKVRFDLDIDTAAPILVDNNLARAEITADLRLIGTPYEPGLNGRLTVLEQSEVRLNERRYEVERGTITFLGERRILPSFDLQLATEARNYDITLAVTGTPADTDTTLTSNPPLPEPDIMALLVTGRTLDEMRGEEFEIAQEQVLSYLTGRVGSQLGRGLRQATGLDTVRIEPQLIANEADPTARLTVGEDIADDLELIYSVDLTDSNDQIWIAEYDVTRRFQTRTVRQSDNSYRVDFRHDLRFGGTPEPARVPRRRPIVGDIAIATDGKLSEAEVRNTLKARPGRQYDFFGARDSVQEIERDLERRGYLQSRVRLQRTIQDDTVDLRVNVSAGPQVSLVFEGATPPEDVVDAIRTKWRRGVFDTQRLSDSEELLRGWLMEDDYLQPGVQGAVEEIGPEERRVRFGITPGVKFTQVTLGFDGAKGIAAKTLDRIIEDQQLELQLFTDPVQVTELLERYYREQGFLTASIDEPRYDFQGTRARVVLSVSEGPRFIVRNVAASGTAAVSSETLVSDLPVRAGDPFLPFAAENALQHIRDVYWKRGYNDLQVDYQLALDRAAGRVDVTFEVGEGRQSVIAEILVRGNDKTSERLVREQLELHTAQPLDLGALARSRRNLYDTQAFSVVDIERQPVAAGEGVAPPDAPAAAEQSNRHQPVRLLVDVREVQPIQLRYGASFDTERGAGGIFDISHHNALGKARVVGLQTRADSQLTDVRAYITQPSLRYWPVRTTAAVYFRDERNPETRLTRRFDVDRRGASINQERELGNQYLWNWGFRYERARSFDPAEGGTLDEFLTVTPLTSTLTRETRDEILDATRGAFLSQAFSYSPTWLGADRAYIKYFGQYFHYFPLQPERRERFTNEILRPRFVYAVAVRTGLAKGFGDRLPVSERFFAGGSSTLRGFEQNALGPIGLDGLPEGGSAMLVINNELRFPLVSIFDGVVFSDVGNVFPRMSDFSFTDLRNTAGVGLRVRTPWFLVRGDYGVLLDRRTGERRSRFYFSLGQAF